jgi:hypothetical protein
VKWITVFHSGPRVTALGTRSTRLRFSLIHWSPKARETTLSSKSNRDKPQEQRIQLKPNPGSAQIKAPNEENANSCQISLEQCGSLKNPKNIRRRLGRLFFQPDPLYLQCGRAWGGGVYRRLERVYHSCQARKTINVSHSGNPAHVSLPGVHVVVSLLKRWLLVFPRSYPRFHCAKHLRGY